jgi:hypothetical protein
MKIKFTKLSAVLVCLLLVFLLQRNVVSAEIIATQDLSPIEALLKTANKDTLVIFDVDDVLIMPTTQIFQRPTNDKILKELFSDLKSRLGNKREELLYSLILLQEPSKLVDPNILSLIKDLQTKGVPVLGLTALSTGSMGKILFLEDWRIQTLNDLGINLNRYWIDVSPKKFLESNIKDPNRPPAFKKGVLFSSKTPKGKVLKYFLQYVNFTPKKIIFIDDWRENLVSVEKFCKERGIEFIGFEYSGAYRRDESLNEARARLQFKILENEQKWLSDEQTDKRMKNHGSDK